MSTFTNIEAEIAETESLLTKASFPAVRNLLQTHLDKLRKEAAQPPKPSVPPSINLPPFPTTTDSTKFACASSSGKYSPLPGSYTPIESFAWDQGAYNTPTLTVFVDLPNVGTVKDHVEVRFGTHSFDLRVLGLNGKNYRLVKENLEKDIVPHESTFVVKNNRVVIKLQKKKGEFSYDHWTALTSKKKREESDSGKTDPMVGLMDMMKNMYEEGDDSMRKIIGEAMLKSARGEKSNPLDMEP